MPTKRRLEDLYVVGKEVNLDDGQGEAVQVWIQKLNPVELNSAMRMANAQRARVRTVKVDPTSDEYMALWLDVLDWERREDLVEYLVAEPLMRIQDRTEAKLAAEDEWSKDDYLQGLRDAWDGGLATEHAAAPTSETKRVLGELDRFAKAAEAMSADDAVQARAEYEVKAMEELQQEVLDKLISYKSNAAWLEEFHRAELLYGVRDPDNHKVRYFGGRDQLDQLSAEVLGQLLSEFAAMSVDVIEGKGLAVTPTSSASSEPPAEEEEAAPSGLAIVAQ